MRLKLRRFARKAFRVFTCGARLGLVFYLVTFFTYMSVDPMLGFIAKLVFPSKSVKVSFTPSLNAQENTGRATYRGKVEIDNTAPKILITSPVSPNVSGQSVAIRGLYIEKNLLKITANGVQALVNTNSKEFIVPNFLLSIGTNRVIIEAEDLAGNTGLTNLLLINNLFTVMIDSATNNEISFQNLTVEIPAGSLSTNKLISINIAESVGLPANLIPIGEIYSINVFSTNTLCFDNNVEISIKYDPQMIPPGFTEGDIRIYVRERWETDWRVTRLKSIDSTNHVVTAEVPCFSDYTVGALSMPDSPAADANVGNDPGNLPSGNPFGGMTMISKPAPSFDGSCHVSYPITVPVDRHGFQPQVLLNYISDRRNGICGAGWDLSTDYISRSTKNGVPTYTMADMFTYCGQELVPIGNNEFRLRHEGLFYAFKYDPDTDRWSILDNEGNTYIYSVGELGRSDQGISGKSRWLLTEVTDKYKRRIRYTYLTDENRTYPRFISYSEKEITIYPPPVVLQNGNIIYPPPQNIVIYNFGLEFKYGERSDIEDEWRSGLRTRTKLILTNIGIYSRPELSAENICYSLKYKLNPSIFRLTLTNFQKFDNGSIINQNILGYTTPSNGVFRVETALVGCELYSAFQPLFADTDGDGVLDILFGDYPNRLMLDVNGDGKKEIQAFISSYWRKFYPADFNGDKKEDCIDFVLPDSSHKAGYFNIYISSGTNIVKSTDQWQKVPINAPGVSARTNSLHVGDFNGDGKSDIMFSDLTYLISTGSNFTKKTCSSSIRAQFGKGFNIVNIGDFNADGLQDLLLRMYDLSSNKFRYHVVVSEKTNFYDSGHYFESSVTNISVADANGDGRSDIFFHDAPYGIAFFSGLDFEYIKLPVQFHEFHPSPGDFDGDGKADSYFFLAVGDACGDVLLENGTIDHPNTLYYMMKILSDSSPSGYLSAINNNNINYIDIEYKLSEDTSDHTFQPLHHHPIAKILQRDGIQTNKVYYNYQNGLYSKINNEFKGFGVIRVNNGPGLTNITFFSQTPELMGKVWKNETRDLHSNLLQQTVNYWKTQEIHPGKKDIFAFIGESRQTVFDKNGTSVHTKNTSQYEQGNLVRSEDFGYVDSSGNDLDPKDNRISHIEYQHLQLNDLMLNLPVTKYLADYQDVVQSQTWFYYDGLDSGIGSKGELTKIKYYLDGNNDPEIINEYDVDGNIVRTVDVEGNSVRFFYESALNTYCTQILRVVNGRDYTTKQEFDLYNGRLKKITDINLNETRLFYDNMGRITKAVNPGDSDELPSVQYWYGSYFASAGSLSNQSGLFGLSSKASYRIESGKPETMDVYSYYDGLGNLRQQRKPYDDGNGKLLQVASGRVKYDTDKKAFLEGRIYTMNYNSNLSVFSEMTNLFDPVEKQYDVYGNLTNIRYPNGAVQRFEYDNTSIVSYDPKGVVKKTFFNVFGQISEIDELNKSEKIVTKYSYNTLGLLTNTIDPNGNRISIAYDRLGRKVRITDPDLGQNQFLYDQKGRLDNQVDAKGQSIGFGYDEDGRLISKDYGNDQKPEISYSYDDYNGIPTATSLGRLTKTIDQVGTNYYYYDVAGSVTNETKRIRGIQYSTKSRFDRLGRIRQLIYPDNEIVTYGYNNAGLLKSVTGNNQYIKNIRYDMFSQRTNILFGNNTVTRYRYNKNNQLVNLVTSSPSSTLQSLSYKFDDCGNITNILNATKSEQLRYTYDDLNRLTKAECLGSLNGAVKYRQSYRYDKIGNISFKTGMGNYTNFTSALPHAVKACGAYRFTYDDNGNMVLNTNSKTGKYQRIGYNQDNMPVGITNEVRNRVGFEYDFQGNRIIKSNSAGLDTTYVNGFFQVRSDGVVVKHIFDGTRRIVSEQIQSNASSSASNANKTECFWYHTDHLGSSALLTGINGNVVQDISYYPFGETRTNIGTNVTQYKFTGQEFDPETGLYNYNARLYHPVIGKFLSADTIISDPYNSQSFNRYAYVMNNPIHYTDPTGHSVYIVGPLQQGYFSTYTPEHPLSQADLDQISGQIGQQASVWYDAGQAASYVQSQTAWFEDYVIPLASAARDAGMELSRNAGIAANRLASQQKNTYDMYVNSILYPNFNSELNSSSSPKSQSPTLTMKAGHGSGGSSTTIPGNIPEDIWNNLDPSTQSAIADAAANGWAYNPLGGPLAAQVPTTTYPKAGNILLGVLAGSMAAPFVGAGIGALSSLPIIDEIYINYKILTLGTALSINLANPNPSYQMILQLGYMAKIPYTLEMLNTVIKTAMPK